MVHQIPDNGKDQPTFSFVRKAFAVTISAVSYILINIFNKEVLY